VDRPPAGPNAFQPPPRGLILLAGFIALIEIVLSLADAGFLADGTLRSRVYIVGAFWTALLHGAEPLFGLQPLTMFVTHALLHGGFLHMAMNLAILLGLGRFAADRYGPGVVLPVFLASAIGGGIAFGLLSDGAYPMVGASGAVFGFLGVWVVWDWYRHRAVGASTRPIWVRVAVLAALNLVFFIGLEGMVAWEAHLGGFLVGLLAGQWLETRLARAARRARAEARLAAQRRGSQ
jgi:rhomboid protease GluP